MKYTYNSNGNLIKTTQGDFEYTYTYDSKGNVIKAIGPDIYNYNNYGKSITYDITCDENGNITKITSKDASNTTCTYTFEYKKVSVSEKMNKYNKNAEVQSLFNQLKIMDIVINVVPDVPSFEFPSVE